MGNHAQLPYASEDCWSLLRCTSGFLLNWKYISVYILVETLLRCREPIRGLPAPQNISIHVWKALPVMHGGPLLAPTHRSNYLCVFVSGVGWVAGSGNKFPLDTEGHLYYINLFQYLSIPISCSVCIFPQPSSFYKLVTYI